MGDLAVPLAVFQRDDAADVCVAAQRRSGPVGCGCSQPPPPERLRRLTRTSYENRRRER